MKSDRDTSPWYKQFWLWFIIFLPACAVIASISTVIVAFKKADSLVIDDYYKEGLAVNLNLGKEKLAHELGLQAIFSADTETRTIAIELIANQEMDFPEMLLLKFIHPFDSEKDMDLPLIAMQENTQRSKNYQQSYYQLASIDWRTELTPLYLNTPESKQKIWLLKQRFNPATAQ